jgi:hypothetical protein
MEKHTAETKGSGEKEKIPEQNSRVQVYFGEIARPGTDPDRPGARSSSHSAGCRERINPSAAFSIPQILNRERVPCAPGPRLKMGVVLSGGWFLSETRVNMSWLGVFNVAFS